ncbi:MAG: TrkH family potassium uptake protein [Candidatus Fimadaptatus sp.]|jgi:trk system potassium uptake protein TrkH
MNYKMMGRIASWILSIEAAFMLPALMISAFSGEAQAAWALGISAAVTMAVAGVLALLCRKARTGLLAREGLVCVGLSWILMSLFGCLPFYLSREIPSFIDALFEIVSGFTTTGASILTDVEALSNGLLYWRSFSHWLGGMGVLVFLLAVLPGSGRAGGYSMHLLRAESPGPNVGKLVPKMKQTAMILYVLYILLTVVNVIFLLAGDMPLFDAVCTAFGTAGTGGFGIKNSSMADYSPYIQNVCTVFMFLFGVNFNIYYMMVMRRFMSIKRDDELKLYVGMALISTVLIAINIRSMYSNWSDTIRHSAFQVSSIMTTTGFATTDFDLWPSFSKSILLCLMIVGASAGSTGGGIKCSRVLLLFRLLRRSISQVLHPQNVQVIRAGGHSVEEKVLERTYAYLAAYVMIILMSFVLISLDGFSLMANFSAVLACFNNIGPGLEAVGPVCNYSGFSVLSKLVLIFDMLAGRLEIFPILLLLTRRTWRKW